MFSHSWSLGIISQVVFQVLFFIIISQAFHPVEVLCTDKQYTEFCNTRAELERTAREYAVCYLSYSLIRVCS